MKRSKPTYDYRCKDLAEYFLEAEADPGPVPSDHGERCHLLAIEIQKVVEDWITSHPPQIDEITRVLG